MLGSTVLFAALQLTATIRHARRDERPQWARRELNPPQLACRDMPPCKLVVIRARRFLLPLRALTAQTAGKKSQTRPVLRPGRTSGRNLSSVFSGAVRGTRPLFSETVAYQRLLSRSLLSRPCSAARALLPMLPAVLAALAFMSRCSRDAVPFCTAYAARSYAVLERSEKNPMRHTPPSRRSIGEIVGESRTKRSRTRAFRVCSSGATPGFAQLEHLYRTMLCRVGQVYCYNSS